MKHDRLTLSRGDAATTQQRQGKGRIPQAEWPNILARQKQGETISAIARDYGVTGPAIRYILKKAEAAGLSPAAGQPDRDDEAATPESVADAPAASTEMHEQAASAEAVAEVRSPANDTPRSELAQRLTTAAAECSRRFDALGDEADDPEGAKEAIHEVRRALAAIEIALGRRPQRRRQPSGADGGDAAHDAGPHAEVGGDGQAAEDGSVVGKVKFFNPDKGYGFVKPDDGGKDIFVPLQAVERSGHRTLQPDQRVKVTITRGQKGLQADRITLLSA